MYGFMVFERSSYFMKKEGRMKYVIMQAFVLLSGRWEKEGKESENMWLQTLKLWLSKLPQTLDT